MSGTLEALYQDRVRHSRSICGHMATLRALAAECPEIVEFGIRAAYSSTALLAGLPPKGRLTSYDIEERAEHQMVKAAAEGKDWEIRYMSSTDDTPFPCDMVFHDSYHSYAHVTAELGLWADHASKYLVFHDSIQHAVVGGGITPSGITNDGSGGIRLAIDELMIRDPSWFIKAHYPNNDGLLVLERR